MSEREKRITELITRVRSMSGCAVKLGAGCGVCAGHLARCLELANEIEKDPLPFDDEAFQIDARLSEIDGLTTFQRDTVDAARSLIQRLASKNRQLEKPSPNKPPPQPSSLTGPLGEAFERLRAALSIIADGTNKKKHQWHTVDIQRANDILFEYGKIARKALASTKVFQDTGESENTK